MKRAFTCLLFVLAMDSRDVKAKTSTWKSSFEKEIPIMNTSLSVVCCSFEWRIWIEKFVFGFIVVRLLSSKFKIGNLTESLDGELIRRWFDWFRFDRFEFSSRHCKNECWNEARVDVSFEFSFTSCGLLIDGILFTLTDKNTHWWRWRAPRRWNFV